MVRENRTLLWYSRKGILLGGSLTLLLGCAFSNHPTEPPPNTQPDPADLMILNAVTSISENLNKIEGKDIPISTPSPSETKPRENRPIDIKWNGPLETLLLLLGQTYNREVRILGTPPMTPVMINISRTSHSLEEVIEAIAQYDTLPNWVNLTITPTEINLVYVSL